MYLRGDCKMVVAIFHLTSSDAFSLCLGLPLFPQSQKHLQPLCSLQFVTFINITSDNKGAML